MLTTRVAKDRKGASADDAVSHDEHDDQHGSDDDSDHQCDSMIIFQLVVFVLFYVSLIVIIVLMYCKYRRECVQMAKNEGSEANFRMVKRLMEQYDKK